MSDTDAFVGQSFFVRLGETFRQSFSLTIVQFILNSLSHRLRPFVGQDHLLFTLFHLQGPSNQWSGILVFCKDSKFGLGTISCRCLVWSIEITDNSSGLNYSPALFATCYKGWIYIIPFQKNTWHERTIIKKQCTSRWIRVRTVIAIMIKSYLSHRSLPFKGFGLQTRIINFL